ncbi:MAG: TonB-dependent receptor [Tannerellaceae bacterium]|jgi:TonB-linked SusC/RagA family outer membrane protein|nr:TonB-dependent receptor [Tannerellaceae bacterium]
MKKYLILLFVCISLALNAQQINITGHVISTVDNEPISGASVFVKGTTKGVITDINGNYSLNNMAPDAVINFSMLGYKMQNIPVNGRTVINVLMDEDMALLDEVVVVGYGVVKKSDLTSSISTVKGNELNQMSVGNAMTSLQGKINGVQIVNEGAPGAIPRVIIRGVTTVNGSNPLYVVDGMPVGDNINFLNQNDIESMEVLKDASAAAIYGTRGSNGVILITTKKGKIGKTLFQLNSSVGFQTIAKPEMAKASEYEKVFKQRYLNDGSTPVWNGKDNITDAEGTDWWDETVKGVALTQSYDLSFQGGNDKLIYSASIGYFKQNSHYDYGYWDKLTARFNMEYKFNKVVSAGVDLLPKLERWDDTPNLLNDAMRMDPSTPVFRPQEEWTDNKFDNYARSRNSQVWNPMTNVARMTAHSDEYGTLMTPFINIEPLSGVVLRSQFGVNARFRLSDNFTPAFFIDNLEQNEESLVERTMNHWIDWNWTNIATFMKTFADKHNLNLMGGYTMEKFSSYWLSGSRKNTPSNLKELQYINAGTTAQTAEGTNEYTSLMSYLGRLTYNYDYRYYLTASIRVDGSSKFPEGNKHATFPAVSGAWRISGEEFMKDHTFFTNLKLRAGWGRVGNQNIANDAYLTLIDGGDYVFGNTPDRYVGTAVSSVGNTSLRWETVEDFNVGLDIGLLKGRLNITADLFQKKSHDMLLEKENLLILGYPMWNGRMWTNIGEMKATGWELATNWNDKVGNFNYEVGVNLSSVKNVAEKLLGESAILTGGFHGDYIIRNEEGGEISRFYGYIADGIFQNQTEINAHTGQYGDKLQPDAVPGDIRFKDVNYDGVLDEKDKVFLGSAFPDLMIGLNIRLGYKNFDLVSNFYGTVGNDLYNVTRNLYAGTSGENVYAGTSDKAWHGEGTSNFVPRLSVNDLNRNYQRVSGFFVEDGSYFRCKLLQIGYTIPPHLLNGIGARISFSAQNLFTITNYSGVDPERAAGGSVTESGIDTMGYPNPRTFLLGINLHF